MLRPIRWLLLSFGGLFIVAIAGVAAITWRSHSHEGTYYGPRTDILHIGERVVTPQSTRAVVESDPAWDEDSCYPDRPIRVRLDSGEMISIPRHDLHR
jgi:hypothetical protein